jgi:hypothetical protein
VRGEAQTDIFSRKGKRVGVLEGCRGAGRAEGDREEKTGRLNSE